MKFNLPIAVAVLTVMTAISSCATRAADEPKANSTTEAAGLPVDVEIVSQAPLQHTEVIAGSLVPNREVTLTSEVNRKVVAVLFHDGSHVSMGQVLYRLDDSDIRARIRQLHADLQLAEINEDRLRELRKTETVRQEEYDVAYARLHTLKAAEDVLEVELSRTYIRAPFAGQAGISKIQAGTVVSPGMPLVSIQEQATVKVQFSVPEKYVSLVKKGTRVRFSTELNETREAVIIAAEAAVDVQTRTITVQAVAANPAGRLKPGMSAKVYFSTAPEGATGMMLSSRALIPGGGGYNVFVVKNGRAATTPVTVGSRNEEQAVITGGLQNGDTVMVSNILRAMDGAPVQIMNLQPSQN